MPIYRRIEAGELELMSDDEIIAEERLLIENLDGITSYFASDHILNLLEELDGKLPDAKGKMLATIDRYLALSGEDRESFRLGRRAGYYRALNDMDNPELRSRVDRVRQRIGKQSPGNLDSVISDLMESFIQNGKLFHLQMVNIKLATRYYFNLLLPAVGAGYFEVNGRIHSVAVTAANLGRRTHKEKLGLGSDGVFGQEGKI